MTTSPSPFRPVRALVMPHPEIPGRYAIATDTGSLGEMAAAAGACLTVMLARGETSRVLDMPRAAGADIRFTLDAVLPCGFMYIVIEVLPHEAPIGVEPSLE